MQVGCTVTLAIAEAGGDGMALTINEIAEEMHPVLLSFTFIFFCYVTTEVTSW